MAENGVRRVAASKAKLGSGKRFAGVQSNVAQEYEKKGINPKKAKAIGAAVAATQGKLKYGAKKMAKMSAAGKANC